DQLYVCDKKGKIWRFTNHPDTNTKSEFLDLSQQIKITPNAGLGGLAFHPDFGLPSSPNRGFLYLHYYWSPSSSQRGPANQVPDSADELANPGYWRLSRFTVQDGQTVADPTSELILIQQFDAHHWHNGGSIFFDNEGFLYLSSGDIGGDKNVYKAGQTLRGGLFGTVLRIDVDQDLSRSHPIRRQPTHHDIYNTMPAAWAAVPSYSQGYTIPDDNPWLDPAGGNLEEFWCIGIRSPHRMSYDPPTGEIWVGDVGQFRREEVNLITKGANYQWPYLDGTLGGYRAKPNPLIGTDAPPAYQYAHGANGAAVIGGYVYRGIEHDTELGGKYLFAEHQNGQVWALDRDDNSVAQLTSVSGSGFHTGISSFGQDNNGELYLCRLKRSGATAVDGQILKLSRSASSNHPEPPALLSQTGAFSNTPARTPADTLIPYSPNAPLWSDGTLKQRYLAIPDRTQIGFDPTGNWSFPEGSVFIKHFDSPDGDPLETRFLIHGSDANYFGYTYRWREDGSDADLLTKAESRTLNLADGSTLKWDFPSRAQCLQCHTAPTGRVLGLRTHQLNGELRYPNGTTDNQLRSLDHIGLFSTSLSEEAIAGFARSYDIRDPHPPLQDRIRSYLDSNCSHCHQPGGVYASFDARFTTPLTGQGLINGGLIRDYGIDGQGVIRPRLVPLSILHSRMASAGGSRMPPLATNQVDREAVRVISEWIHSLDPAEFPDNALPPPDNYPPLARSDIAYISPAPLPSQIEPLANDRDPDGILDPLSLNILATPDGSATIDGSVITYSPTDPATQDSFTYRVADEHGLVSNEARITIEIRADHLNWLGENFTESEQSDPEFGAWDADPDGDGSTNLMEYARGTDPRARASAPSIAPEIEISDGDRFHTLTVTKAPYADADWTIEASTDLETWIPATLVSESPSQLTARAPITGTRSYLRLKVRLVE
ncbi:MAG: PQQ-dependent sugar dehydrogenase, partial [Verrucomicrobiales bacterium]